MAFSCLIRRAKRLGIRHAGPLHAPRDMADSLQTVICDAVTLGSYGQTVSSSTYQTSWPSLWSYLGQFQIEPALTAERAPAHHPENNESPAYDSFCRAALLLACSFLPQSTGRNKIIRGHVFFSS